MKRTKITYPRLLILTTVLIALSSCQKKASDLIVGNWVIERHYYYTDDFNSNGDINSQSRLDGKVWKFEQDGSLSCFFLGCSNDFYASNDSFFYTISCKGSYAVNGHDFSLEYTTDDSLSAKSCQGSIIDIADNGDRMTIVLENQDANDWPFDQMYLYFVRTNEAPSQGNSMSERTSLVFQLYDEYGDGWNGAYLTIGYPDGSEETMTFEDGLFLSYSRNVFVGDVVWLEWHHGGDDQECSFEVLYDDGTVAFENMGGFDGRKEITVRPND